MFLKQGFIASLLLTALFSSSAYMLMRYDESDVEYCRSLSAIALANKPKIEGESHCEQWRSGVTKDLWTQERKCTHMEAKESKLALVTLNGKVQPYEWLTGVICQLPDEGEGRRTFQTERGEISYGDYRFTSPEVMLTQYEDDAPALRGLACNASLTLKEKSPEFSATHFKATIEAKDE